MTTRILLVEDDNTLLETLSYNLKNEGYKVTTASDGQTGLALGRKKNVDLILLDVMLPGLDGLSVCRILRREGTETPIILLTARSGEMDKIVGLDSGADDYITKPFSLGELLARVRAALRHKRTRASSGTLEVGDLTIDLVARRVIRHGERLNLSHKEFDLLTELVQNQGAVLSRDLLLTKVWGYDYTGGTRTVDVHIRWLREKIEDDPSHPKHILTVRGIGYRFEA